MQLDPQRLRIFQILFPYAFKKTMDLELNHGRLVHYTSAEAALSMVRNKEVWMRNSSVVNDFMEIEYGIGCLMHAYNGAAGDKLKKLLNGFFPGFTDELEKHFNGWAPNFRTDTYITAVSEHLHSEDTLGRLSMWRAYGGTTGVAVVLNRAPFLLPSNALKAYSSPVAYFSRQQFIDEFNGIADAIEANGEFISALGRETLMGYVFWMFRSAALCTKHPGFLEEKEWRVIYSPKYEHSERLVEDIQVINGVPQRIYKIPLKDVPEEGFVGAEIPQLVERVIIGPTQYPLAIYDACVSVLLAAGMQDAPSRVYVSDIPLRQ